MTPGDVTVSVVNAMAHLEKAGLTVRTMNIVIETGIPRRTVQRELNELEKLGAVVRVGEGVHTTWKIN